MTLYYSAALNEAFSKALNEAFSKALSKALNEALSKALKRGIERGARENAVKNILTVLNTRFPESDIPQADTALQEIISRERLDQILNTALIADTFNDFLKALHL